MQATTSVPHGHDLRALLHVIRQGWSEKERERRQQIAEHKQRWLMGVVQKEDRQAVVR